METQQLEQQQSAVELLKSSICVSYWPSSHSSNAREWHASTLALSITHQFNQLSGLCSCVIRLASPHGLDFGDELVSSFAWHRSGRLPFHVRVELGSSC